MKKAGALLMLSLYHTKVFYFYLLPKKRKSGYNNSLSIGTSSIVHHFWCKTCG
jgi:hypothetical protein